MHESATTHINFTTIQRQFVDINILMTDMCTTLQRTSMLAESLKQLPYGNRTMFISFPSVRQHLVDEV